MVHPPGLSNVLVHANFTPNTEQHFPYAREMQIQPNYLSATKTLLEPLNRYALGPFAQLNHEGNRSGIQEAKSSPRSRVLDAHMNQITVREADKAEGGGRTAKWVSFNSICIDDQYSNIHRRRILIYF